MLGVSKSLVDKCCVGDGVSSSVFFPVCGFEGRMGKAFAGSEVFFFLFFFLLKGSPLILKGGESLNAGMIMKGVGEVAGLLH